MKAPMMEWLRLLTCERYDDAHGELVLVHHVVLDGREGGGAPEGEEDHAEGQEKAAEAVLLVDSGPPDPPGVQQHLSENQDAGQSGREQRADADPPACAPSPPITNRYRNEGRQATPLDVVHSNRVTFIFIKVCVSNTRFTQQEQLWIPKARP